MTTVKQIERLWRAQSYRRLFGEILSARPEAVPHLESHLGRAVTAAAMGIIRLDELTQAHVPLYSRFVRTILAAQEADGGWGDPMTTALCLRALLCGRGEGEAIRRGLKYLANLQKSEGIWPRVPIRRTDADALASAWILFHLGAHSDFRAATRFDDAVAWFESNANSIDSDARRLWDRAKSRCQLWTSRRADRAAALATN